MIGPGKYDDLVTYVREQAKARGVILLVIDGERGSGFSVQVVGDDLTRVLPRLLREVANGIEGDSFTCPQCGRVSHHPQDVANRYCGACHQFFEAAS